MRSKKIGLLTIHDTVNYGSLLQTYSTFLACKKLGANIKLIDYKCSAIEHREKPVAFKDCRSLHDLYRYFMFYKDLKKKYDNMHQFIVENMDCTHPFFKETISETNNLFDTFLVGSDIVWGTQITGNDYTYFLDFVDEKKRRLSFSSSVGTEWTEDEKQTIEPLLKKFERITVREQIAADWIEKLVSIRPKVTCDPTMLWGRDFWVEMQDTEFVPKGKYVLIYAINPDKSNITDGIKYAREHGMPAYFINFYKPVKGSINCRPVTVNQWIAMFANAEVVFSASYHGLLFSLYFHKPVFFYNRGEKSRMISLAEEFRIKHREGNAENLKNNREIDFGYVDEKLREKQDYSWNILKEYMM